MSPRLAFRTSVLFLAELFEEMFQDVVRILVRTMLRQMLRDIALDSILRARVGQQLASGPGTPFM